MVSPDGASSAQAGCEDMIHLDNLTEETILSNLELRYNQNLIYTYVGSILVSVNPYQMLPIYGTDLLRTYHATRLSDLPPHIFAIADEAHYSILRKRSNQCILISGESGAGKTEATKLILQSLTALSQSHQWVEEQIIEANTVLEAFGNAKTIRNDNSSRFGKYVAIQFDTAGKVLGANIINYLLEKSRVTNRPDDERSFHVFYQLLRGSTAEEKTEFDLRPEAFYKYLQRSGEVKDMDDAKNFTRLKTSLHVVGFSDLQIKQIFQILSSLLLLGNLTFALSEGKPQDQTLILSCSPDILDSISKRFEIESKDLLAALTRRLTVTRGESISSPLTMDKAYETRDALAKALFDGLFRWIVDQTNSRITAAQSQSPILGAIGVLDIFGFENFNVNTFEQLCINYANEQLQNFFNKYIFAIEQAEYRREGITWSEIEFHDNQPCLDLFVKKTGLLALIDEESGLASATDASLLEKLHSNNQKHPNYRYVKTTSQTHFGVQHFAGEIHYSIAGFLAKNRDALNTDVTTIMSNSRSSIISAVFLASLTFSPVKEKKTTIKSLKKALHQVSVASQFHESLTQLMVMLDASSPHFIRCIKPNQTKQPNNFDAAFAMTQLRYTGLLETVRIRKLGFPIRWQFKLFIDRFGLLTKPMMRVTSKDNDQKAMVKTLMSTAAVDASAWQLGTARVFLRTGASVRLEVLRDQKLSACARRVQLAVRAWRLRKRFLRRRKAAITIQKWIKSIRQRRRYLELRTKAYKIRATWLMFRAKRRYDKMLDASIVIQTWTRRFLAVTHYRQQRAFLEIIQIGLRNAIARRKLESLYYDRVQTEEVKKQRQAEVDKFRAEMLEKQKSVEKIEEEKRLKALQEVQKLERSEERRVSSSRSFGSNLDTAGDDINRRGSKRPQLFSEWDQTAAFEARRFAQMEEIWLRPVRMACPPLPQPTIPSYKLKPDDLTARKASLTGYTFAKYAATYFQSKQSPVHSKDAITRSLLAISSSKKENTNSLALESFRLIQQFMEPPDTDNNSIEADDPTSPAAQRRRASESKQVVDLIRNLIIIGIQNPELRDEIYCQICKQTNGCRDRAGTARGWYLMALCLGCFPPSPTFEPYFESYIIQNGPHNFDNYNWHQLREISAANRPRRFPPAKIELVAVLDQCLIPIQVKTETGVVNVHAGATTTHQVLINAVAEKLGLRHTTGFGISVNGYSIGDAGSFLMDAISAVELEAKSARTSTLAPAPAIELRFRKEFFLPSEYVFDSVAVDLVCQQIFNMVRGPSFRCGVDAALIGLAIQTLIKAEGQVPDDIADSLLQLHAVELQSVVRSYGSELGINDVNGVVNIIIEKAKAYKSPSIKEIKLRLITDAQAWPRLFYKLLSAKQVLGTASAPTLRRVTFGIGKSNFIITDNDSFKEITHSYCEIVSMESTTTTLQIGIGLTTKYQLETQGEVAENLIKSLMREMKTASNIAIAVTPHTMTSSTTAINLLAFKKDDIITITLNGEGSPWWRGYLRNDPEKKVGTFPREAIQLLCGEFVSLQACAFQLSLDGHDAAAASAPSTPVTPSSLMTLPRAGKKKLSMDHDALNSADKTLQSYALQFMRTNVSVLSFGTFSRGSIRETLRGTFGRTLNKLKSASATTADMEQSELSQPITMSKSVVFARDAINEPLHLELDKEEDKKTAAGLFQMVMKIMGDYPSKKPPMELTIGLIEKGLSLPSETWRDELLLQVLKQTNRNKNKISVKRGWDLFCVCISFLPPSRRLEPVLAGYFTDNQSNKNEAIAACAKYCNNMLKRVLLSGSRRKYPPDAVEVESIQAFRPLVVKVYFPQGFSPAYKGLSIDPVSTVKEAVDIIADKLAIQNSSVNAIYKVCNGNRRLASNDMMMVDIIHELREDAMSKNVDLTNDKLCRLEYRKKIFADPNAEEQTSAVANLVYVQMLEVFKSTHVMASVEEVIELAALQLRLHCGDAIPKELGSVLQSFIPVTIYPQATPVEWEQRILKLHHTRVGTDKPDEIIKILNETFAKSPYYGTEFFEVMQVYDSQMPSRVTIGINRSCIYLIDTQKRIVLATFKYGEVGAWSANEERFAMKIGSMVGGQRFIADTIRGKDMTDLLEAYVQALVQQKAKQKPAPVSKPSSPIKMGPPQTPRPRSSSGLNEVLPQGRPRHLQFMHRGSTLTNLQVKEAKKALS